MDILLIAETQRQSGGTKSRCADARNRDGIIRTQHHEAALCVGQLIHLLLRKGVRVAVEDIVEFERRGNDFAVAACGKKNVQAVFELTAQCALIEKRIACAFGGNAVVFVHKDTPLRLL